MKICISSTGANKESLMDVRFGRCSHFVIFDDETKTYESVENSGITAAHGAGIAAAQQVVDAGVKVVITGNIGPNAMRVLQGANVTVYKGQGESIEQEIKNFQEEKLTIISQPGPAHSGTSNR